MAIEENFPSNSNRSHSHNDKLPTVQNKLEPVVQSGVKKQEKHSFLAADFKDVQTYLLTDVIVPAAKDLLYSIGSKGLSLVLWGEDKSPTKRNGTRFNYNSISSSNSRDDRPPMRIRTAYNYQDLLFDSRADAERVLEEMCDIFEKNEFITVGDMYDLAGQRTIQTDFDYGWTDLRTARVRASGDGYYIEMPRIEQISRR